MKKILLLFLISVTNFGLYTDVNTDKAMAKISHDTKTYISADVRAATEEEAYNEAMNKLSARIADYFRTERPDETLPDAIYFSNISSICERMSSKIADNRHRVMLYVRKSDLKLIGGTANALVLSKTGNNSYSPVPTETPEPLTIIKIDTAVTVVNKPLDSTLSTLSQLTTRNEIVEKLQALSKSKYISGAAKFPLSHANNFYVVVLEGDRVVNILHYSNNCYRNIETSDPVDISQYSHCTGYWFTF